MTDRAEFMRRQNIAESCKLVDEALEHMQGCITAQNKAMGEITKIVQQMAHTADRTQGVAREAAGDAAMARRVSTSCINTYGQFVNMTFWQRWWWLLTGKV